MTSTTRTAVAVAVAGGGIACIILLIIGKVTSC